MKLYEDNAYEKIGVHYQTLFELSILLIVKIQNQINFHRKIKIPVLPNF